MTDQIGVKSVDDEPNQLLDFVLDPNQAPGSEGLLDLARCHGSESFDGGIDVCITGIKA